MSKNNKIVSRKNRKSRARAGLSASSKEALSILDPFGPLARTAKYPDGSARATLVAQIVEETSVAADASGEAAFTLHAGSLSANLEGSNDVGTTVTGGVVTWDATKADPAQYSSLAAIASHARIVSAGMYYIPTAATDSNGGRIYVSNTLDRPVSISECHNEKIYRSSEPLLIAAIPLGSLARQFTLVADTVATDWTVPTMIFQGLTASQTCGYIRRVFNVEYTPLLGTVSQQMGAGVKPHNPHVMAALSDGYQAPHIVGGLNAFASFINNLGIAVGGVSIALGAYRQMNQSMGAFQGYVPFSGN